VIQPRLKSNRDLDLPITAASLTAGYSLYGIFVFQFFLG